MPSPSPRLILASSSRYRQELLSRLGLSFQAISPDVDERAHPGESAKDRALRLAKLKAGVIAESTPNALIIGSDQVATLDGEHIGKPGTHAAALQQLQRMRGKTVIFHTAVCLWDTRGPQAPDGVQLDDIETRVTFRTLPDAELDAYLRIEQPYDCAGSAKNEGLGIALLEKIESTDPTALTGLPLIAVTTMLRQAGVGFFLTPTGT